MKDRPTIIFMGTPDFAVPPLEALLESGQRVVAVVTQPDRPQGRGRRVTPSAVKRAALSGGVEVWQPERASEPGFVAAMRGKAPDIVVVVAFGQILKKPLLEVPAWGVLNIHASLLPRYRGPAPVHWAIMNGERETGLSAMRMDEGLDTGPVLLQWKTEIGAEETAGALHDRLAAAAGDFLLQTLTGLVAGRLKAVPQEERAATYAPKIDRRLSTVQWDRSASRIAAQIRALDPWPGACAWYRGTLIKLFSPKVCGAGGTGHPVPGRVKGQAGERLVVEASQDSLAIGELQLPGKKRLSAGAFLRGFPIEPGAVLGGE